MKPALGAALTLVLAVAAPAAWGQKIVRGPYLQWPSTGSMVVVWDLDQPAPAEVRYGPTAAMASTAPSAATGPHHEVQLLGLQAGKTYHYAIYAAGAKISPDHELLAPPAPAAPFRFLVFGDTRSDPTAHQKLIYAMALEQSPGFFINTGDLVATGDQQTLWDTFFQLEGPLISRIPMLPVIGNHDHEGGDASLFYQHFVMKSTSPVPEAFYSFDYGNSHFVVLDSHVNVDPWYVCLLRGKPYDNCFRQNQLSWLQQDLQTAAVSATTQHIFVFIHEGPYSSKSGRTGSAQMRELLPLFKSSGVSMILSGHDHYYERGVSDNGIPYVITGGGGAPLYAIATPCPAPHTVALSQSVHHYNVIDVQGPQIKVTVKTADGTILDQYSLGSPAPPLDGGAPDATSSAADLSTPTDSDGPTILAPDAPAPLPDLAGSPPPQSGGSNGCGCRLGTWPEQRSPWLALLVLLTMARRRRV